MNNKSDPIEDIKLILYPEGLEMSNIISILNENLSFTINELLKLKEIQKIYQNKDQILTAFESIDFLKVSDDKEKAQYLLSDSLVYFNFLNIPGKLNKEEILKVLNLLDSSDKYVVRFYKRYLYWQLVSEDRDFCEEFEKTLKNVKFTEDSKLRYEYLPISLKSTLIKKVQQNIYHKEASELKAKPDKLTLQSGQLTTSFSSDSGPSSWRKKSNDLTGSSGKDEGIKRTRYGGDNYKTSSFNDPPMKRERFNSDGDKAFQNQNSGYGGYNSNCNTGGYKPSGFNTYNSIFQNTIKLDYSKLIVNYNTEIKFKFSNKEMIEMFENISNSQKEKPDFAFFVEDVCSENKKQNLQMLKRNRMYSEDYKKDRAKTFSDYNYNSSFSNKNKFNNNNFNNQINYNSNPNNVSSKLPKNNPLQEMKYNPTSLFK